MGGLESKFNGLLVEGRGEDAELMWNENPDLQSRFRPNSQIKFSPTRDTPLHCTTRHEMQTLLEAFLDKGGDPFVSNSNGDTPLHLVCTSAKFSSRRSKRKANQLTLLLQKMEPQKMTQSLKKGTLDEIKKSSSEKKFTQSLWLLGGVSGARDGSDGCGAGEGLGVQNKARNTPLHLAAASGLLDCVELLLAHNAPLFVHNVAGQTPCDVAWEAKQLIIAKQLESKMVFANDDGSETASRPKERLRMDSFHDTRALHMIKKEIVENVSRELQLPEFPAQALLMAYGWSEELVREAWDNDMEGACEKAGIDVGMTTEGAVNGEDSLYTSLSVHRCGICDDEIPPMDRVRVPCDHNFCQDCWTLYLESQINEGAGREIRCPGYQCYKLVPEEVISDMVSADQLQKYSDLNIKQFVESSSDIRWCPFPDCGYAICIRGKGGVASGDVTTPTNGVVGMASDDDSTPGRNVECGRGHGFCWHCMKEPHEPTSCELWERWKEVVSRMTNDDEAKKVASQAQADARWIIRNTKPCPHCRAPIQKNEGCNHMTCKQCRHDFCWVCLDPWSLHNHRTGGYFTCNRFTAQEKANTTVEISRGDMEAAYMKKATEDLESHTKRFQHYYDRYNNHLHSLDIEMKLLQESTGKMRELERLGLALDKKVAKVKGQSDATIGAESPLTPQKKISVFTAGEATNFLDNIFRILLRARRILSASYCIGYFIPDTDQEALGAHEVLQGKLEEAVEVVSEMVNRQYLRTPRSKMNEAAGNVDYLCSEYLTEMSVVATIANLAVKEAEKPPPPRAPPTPQEDDLPPHMEGIPLGFGPDVPDQPDGERRFRLIGLLNPDGTLHILRVPENEFQFLTQPAD